MTDSNPNGQGPGEPTLARLLEDGLFVDGDWVESKDQDPDGDVRLIQLADVGDGVFRDRSSRFLTSEKAKELRCTFLEAGDVRVARMPEPLGRACTFPGVGQPAVTAVDVCILRPNPERARPDWLVNAINAPQFRSGMEAFVRGTTRQRISRKNLGKLTLVVPSVDVQGAVAVAVDRVETSRQRAVRHLAAARAAVERFRTGVLAAAYARAGMGDGQNAVVPLEALLREPLKNGYSAKPVAHETPFRVLTLTATTSAVFDPHHFKYTDETIPHDSSLWLAPGDILIQRGNTAEYVGVPAVYDGGPGEFIYPDLMIRARVRPEINPRFVWYMLLAPRARQFARERATGTAGNMPKINQQTVKALPIPLPHPAVRADIVEGLDHAFHVAAATLKRLDAADKQLVRLVQATRAKALRGELMPTEVTLADERASNTVSAD